MRAKDFFSKFGTRALIDLVLNPLLPSIEHPESVTQTPNDHGGKGSHLDCPPVQGR